MITMVCLSEYIFPPDSTLSYKHSQWNQMTTNSTDSLSGWTQEQRLWKLSRILEASRSNDKLQQQMSQKASLTIGIGTWHAYRHGQLDHSLIRPSAHGCRQLFYYVMLRTTGLYSHQLLKSVLQSNWAALKYQKTLCFTTSILASLSQTSSVYAIHLFKMMMTIIKLPFLLYFGHAMSGIQDLSSVTRDWIRDPTQWKHRILATLIGTAKEVSKITLKVM